MAIFGNLAEFPILEVIGMLEHRYGILRFSNIGRYDTLEFHVNMGVLQGLMVDGKAWRDGSAAKSIILEVASQRDGQFEFQRMPMTSPEMQNDLAININEVLLHGAVFDDEWNRYKDQLPDPKTRFTLAGQELVMLEGKLQVFWQQIEPLLEYGISIEDLATFCAIDVREAQLNLYKLRTFGVVRVARRVQEVADIRAGQFPTAKKATQPMPRPTAMPSTSSKPGLVSRLLGALRILGRPA